jgi:outer membrane protein TolC
MFRNGVVGAVTATQPLFAGGQIVNGNRLARTGVEVSRLQQQITNDEAIIATEHYYWQLVALKGKIGTLNAAEAMLNRLLADVKSAVDAGVTTRNDLIRVELERNRLAANRSQLENGIRILKLAFGQHIGIADASFDVETPDFEDIFLSYTLPNDTASMQNRPEYRLLEKGVEAAVLQKKMEIGKHLPSVAIGGTYSYSNFDPRKVTEMEKSMGLAFATVSIPLSGWWGGSHAIKKRNLELQAARNTRDETASLLLVQMQKTASELDEAYRQVILARDAIALAAENLRMSETSYTAGVSILSDLLDAQMLVQQSNDKYSEAATDYYMKYAEYKVMYGVK